MLTAALPTAINKIHLILFTVDWEYRVAEKAAFISLSIYFFTTVLFHGELSYRKFGLLSPGES